MTIRFVPTPALLIAGHRATKDFSFWIVRIGTVVVVTVALVIVAAGLIVGRSLGDIVQRTWSLVIAFPLFWLFILPLIPRWHLHRVWKSSPALHGEHVYTFAPNGITLVTPVGRSEIGWNAIVAVGETDDLVLLSFGKSLPHVIPKSALPASGGLAEFRRLVTSAIGARARWRD